MKNIIKYVLCLSLVACIVVFSCLSVSANSVGGGVDVNGSLNYVDGVFPLSSMYFGIYDSTNGNYTGEIVYPLSQPSYFSAGYDFSSDMLDFGGVVSGNTYSYYDIYEDTYLMNGSIYFPDVGESRYCGLRAYDVVSTYEQMRTGYGVRVNAYRANGDLPNCCDIRFEYTGYLGSPDATIPVTIIGMTRYSASNRALPENIDFWNFDDQRNYDIYGEVYYEFEYDGVEYAEYAYRGTGERYNVNGLIEGCVQALNNIQELNVEYLTSYPSLLERLEVEFKEVDNFDASNSTFKIIEITDYLTYGDPQYPSPTVNRIEVNVFDWLLQGIAGVLGTPIFGEGSMTLGTLLLIAVTLPLVFGVLKIFAGG